MLILREKLIRLRKATFRTLCADCTSVLEVVARFLALLELYREGLVAFDQMTALGELTITWTGDESPFADFGGDVDEYGDELEPTEDTAPAEETDEGLELVASADGEPYGDGETYGGEENEP
jgi:segregation and condensation protein A